MKRTRNEVLAALVYLLFSHVAELRDVRFARHPSSGFATFSPRKARGEKALD
jgi:asparagine N-glycosylation enzyme membrane subunit Stt3